jgi:hypothetical protein
VKSVMQEIREQEMAEQGLSTAHVAERSMPADTDMPPRRKPAGPA